MEFHRPLHALAGFHVTALAEVPELIHAGEQWVPRRYVISSHAHNCWEIYLQASGVSDWHSQGKTLKVPANALYIAPPGIVHSLDENVPDKHHFLFAAIDVNSVLQRLTDIAAPWPKDECICIEEASAVLPAFRLLIREVSVNLPFRKSGVRTAVDALVIEVSRLLANCGEMATRPFEHPSVTYAKQLLEHHCGRAWTVVDLAQMVGLSPSHLAEVFVRDTGVSPHQYLLEQRMLAAESYLAKGDLSITDIAMELGFSSSQYFATVFRRLRGRSPRDLRPS